jgi:hypothetical protein
MFRAKGTPRPEVKRFDLKIDSVTVAALLLSAGMGAAFVFYYPEAPLPENKRAALESPASALPVGQSPDRKEPSPTPPDHGPEPEPLPAENSSANRVEEQPTAPQASLGPEPSPAVTPGINPMGSPGNNKTAASQARSPKARTAKPASKTKAAKQTTAKRATATKTSPKKK